MRTEERELAMTPLSFERLPVDEMRARSRALAAQMARRRSVRHFSDEPVPTDVLLDCLAVATTAPSGANLQPWSFVVVTSPAIKGAIRAAAEAEERRFYEGRAPDRWLEDLRPLGTTPAKPYLEEAPALVAIFARLTRESGDTNYYVRESVGIATGFLIMALHQAGLACLTHTPSPMRFLDRILERPAQERAFLLLPVGYPAKDCEVPELERRPFAASVEVL